MPCLVLVLVACLQITSLEADLEALEEDLRDAENVIDDLQDEVSDLEEELADSDGQDTGGLSYMEPTVNFWADGDTVWAVHGDAEYVFASFYGQNAGGEVESFTVEDTCGVAPKYDYMWGYVQVWSKTGDYRCWFVGNSGVAYSCTWSVPNPDVECDG